MEASLALLLPKLAASLRPTCQLWLAAAARCEAERVALAQTHEGLDVEHRLACAAALLLTSLRILLQLAGGLSGEASARSAPRHAACWPLLKTTLADLLASHRKLLTPKYVSVLNSLCLGVFWQPVRFTCTLLHCQPPRQLRAGQASRGSPTLFELLVAPDDVFEFEAAKMSLLRQLAREGMTSVWAMYDRGLSVTKELVEGGLPEPPLFRKRLLEEAAGSGQAAGGSGGWPEAGGGCAGTAGGGAASAALSTRPRRTCAAATAGRGRGVEEEKESVRVGKSQRRNSKPGTVRMVHADPGEEEEEAVETRASFSPEAQARLAAAVAAWRDACAARVPGLKAAKRAAFFRVYDDAELARRAREEAAADAEGGAAVFMGPLPPGYPLYPVFSATARADPPRRDDSWWRPGVPIRVVEEVIMAGQETRLFIRWNGSTYRVHCSARKLGSTASRPRHMRVTVQQPEQHQRNRLCRALYDLLPQPELPSQTQSLLVRSLLLGQAECSARCVMGSKLVEAGTLANCSSLLNRGELLSASQLDVLQAGNARLEFLASGRVRVVQSSLAQILTYQAIPPPLLLVRPPPSCPFS